MYVCRECNANILRNSCKQNSTDAMHAYTHADIVLVWESGKHNARRVRIRSLVCNSRDAKREIRDTSVQTSERSLRRPSLAGRGINSQVTNIPSLQQKQEHEKNTHNFFFFQQKEISKIINYLASIITESDESLNRLVKIKNKKIKNIYAFVSGCVHT